MKDQRKTEIKVGIVVILGLIIFLWILGWAKNFSLRDTDRKLLVKFDNVSGLEIGDYVTVNGVRKGVVDDFDVENNSVIVRLTIEEDVSLQKDALFAVTMLDLMGGKKIDIKPGTSGEEIDYSKIQQGVFYADIPSVMSMLGTVQDDLFTALKEVNITLTSINKYLSDEQMDNELRTSLTNMREISEKLNLMIDENRKGLKELLDNTSELSRNATEIVSANREEIESSIKLLQSVLSRTDSLAMTMNIISEQTLNKENNLGKLLYDDKLMNDLTLTIQKARDLIDLLTEQLKGDGLKVDADVDIF